MSCVNRPRRSVHPSIEWMTSPSLIVSIPHLQKLCYKLSDNKTEDIGSLVQRQRLLFDRDSFVHFTVQLPGSNETILVHIYQAFHAEAIHVD